MIAVPGQREDVRNRRLRRADWRCLLPNPNPRRSICLADGLLAEAVKEISGSMVTPMQDGAGECDLAVAVSPKPALLRALWKGLESGGSCYTEWYSPWTGGVQGVRRRLTAAGFTDVRCYWPWPLPDRAPAAFWLPLDAPAAVNYFQSSRGRDAGPGRAVLYTLQWQLWRMAVALGLMVPVCAVARKPAESGSTPEPAPMLALIQAGWSEWGWGQPPQRLAWLLLTGGFRSINKVVGLVFANGEPVPRLVVKMSRIPESVPALEKEAVTLRALASRRTGGVSGVPQTLFFQERCGLAILGETTVTGDPIWSRLRRDTYRELAVQATDWLADLRLPGPPEPRAAWWQRLVAPVLTEFGDTFGPVVDPHLLQKTHRVLETGLDRLPLVIEQRDFAPWNVLITAQGDLAVLDWESAELRGVPASDLIYFLSYLAFLVDRIPVHGSADLERMRRAYRTNLDPATFSGSVFQECQSRYAGRIGLDEAALAPLRLLTWLIHARSEYRGFVADRGGNPTAANLGRSLFVALWQEELRCLS